MTVKSIFTNFFYRKWRYPTHNLKKWYDLEVQRVGKKRAREIVGDPTRKYDIKYVVRPTRVIMAGVAGVFIVYFLL